MTDAGQNIERGAEAGAYVGAAGATLLWGLSVSEWAVTISAVCAALSFLVHLYFSWRRDQREARKAFREQARHEIVVAQAQEALEEIKSDTSP